MIRKAVRFSFPNPIYNQMKTSPAKLKTILNLLIVLTALLSFSACEKEIGLLEEPAPEIADEDTIRFHEVTDQGDYEPDSPPHDFYVHRSRCGLFGVTLEVVIPRAFKYNFYWEIDGRDAGYLNIVECACGTSATVWVERLSNGVKTQKTVSLLQCTD